MQGLSLTPLPDFNIKRYPYILCRESDGFYLYNPILDVFSKILDYKGNNKVDHYMNEDNVIFDKEKPNVFYTEKNSFYLAKYELNPNLIEALRLGIEE